jgi:ribokinase
MPHEFAITSVLSMDHILWMSSGERITVGSCGFYLAMALATLGADVLYAGAHGDDFDPEAVSLLREAGATIALCPLPGPNARLDLIYDASGDVQAVQYEEASGTAFRVEHLPEAFWDSSHLWIGTGPFELQYAAARRGAEQGRPVCFSPQGDYRGRAGALSAIIPHLSMLFLNERELNGLGFGESNEALAVLLRLNPSLRIIITRGGRGAWLIERDRRLSIPAAPAPRLINTIGAGDTFAGAFVLKTSQGASVEDALRWATCAAALQTRGYAYYELPSAAEVDAFVTQVGAELPVSLSG